MRIEEIKKIMQRLWNRCVIGRYVNLGGVQIQSATLFF